jgi:hypothetical protein
MFRSEPNSPNREDISGGRLASRIQRGLAAKLAFQNLHLSTVTAAAAPAQTAGWMRVTVPFSFVAAGNNCPAGDYTVNIDHSTGLVTLNSQAKSAASAQPRTGAQTPAGAETLYTPCP